MKTRPVSTPSHQFSRISSTTTTTKVTMLVMKNTRPKPAKRRIADRSVVARDSSWGLPLVVEPRVQVLQVRVDVVAHAPLELGDRMRLDPAPVEAEQGLGDAEGGDGQAKRDQRGAIAMLDRPVDNGLDEQRYRDLRADRDDRGSQHGGQLPDLGAEILAQPPERCHRR